MGAPAARVSELALHWAKLGHDVTVLTGFPNHPTGEMSPEYRKKLWRLTLREKYGPVHVIRTWLYPAPNRSAVERILNYTSFFASASVRGLAAGDYDVVIATSPQLLVGLAGWWISRLRRIPFVFEVRDLWPESLLASGVGTERSTMIRVLNAISNCLYRRADRLGVVTESFRDNLVAKRGVAPEKIDVITNGIDPAGFVTTRTRDEIRTSLGVDQRFVVSYTGTIGFAHGLRTLLESAADLQVSAPHVLFLVAGEGAERSHLERLAAEKRLTNVRFLGERPRSEIPALLRASDAGIVMLRKSELFKTVLPSKLFEMLASGCPVILSVDGEARSLLERSGAGEYVPPEDAQALSKAVIRFAAQPAMLQAYGGKGRQFVSEHYSRRQTAVAYLSALSRFDRRVMAER